MRMGGWMCVLLCWIDIRSDDYNDYDDFMSRMKWRFWSFYFFWISAGKEIEAAKYNHLVDNWLMKTLRYPIKLMTID